MINVHSSPPPIAGQHVIDAVCFLILFVLLYNDPCIIDVAIVS